MSKHHDRGQEVVYNKSGSYIEDTASGDRVELTRERGTFKFDAWVVQARVKYAAADEELTPRPVRIARNDAPPSVHPSADAR